MVKHGWGWRWENIVVRANKLRLKVPCGARSLAANSATVQNLLILLHLLQIDTTVLPAVSRRFHSLLAEVTGKGRSHRANKGSKREKVRAGKYGGSQTMWNVDFFFFFINQHCTF